MLKGIKQDIEAIRERDPAARNTFEVLTLYSGLHAVLLHRPAHWLYGRKAYYPARLISQLGRFLTGIEIHPGAKIGRGVLIDHGSGVVIGETAEVGDNCTIYQGVTLGGTGKEKGKRHPTLGKNVMVGSGAKVLGPFEIGDGSKIASNAVVLQPLPPGSTAVGVPAKVVRVAGKKVRKPFDHTDCPDPTALEINKLNLQIERLRKRIDKLEKRDEASAEMRPPIDTLEKKNAISTEMRPPIDKLEKRDEASAEMRPPIDTLEGTGGEQTVQPD